MCRCRVCAVIFFDEQLNRSQLWHAFERYTFSQGIQLVGWNAAFLLLFNLFFDK